MSKLPGSFMAKDPNTEETTATTQLLAELDDALGQCSAMRDIVDQYERLHNIESIAGLSIKAQTLREEIELMEQEFSAERSL